MPSQEPESPYDQWLRDLISNPITRATAEGDIADLELDPRCWLRNGMEIIQSPVFYRGMCVPTHLATAVFSIGAEIFLKGMWLCAQDDCRSLKVDSYVEPTVRAAYKKKLKGLGHNIILIVEKLRTTDGYAKDSNSRSFLAAVEAISNQEYLPLNPEKSWADGRYPFRFYRDSEGKGLRELSQSHTACENIRMLFGRQHFHLIEKWQLSPTSPPPIARGLKPTGA